MSNNYPFVSIVLLNYNGTKFASYWNSLFSLNYPKSKYEIVFVDNGSDDGSETLFAKMAKRFPDINIRMVDLKENCGYSKANNIGAKEAKGDYIVLLSNDIKVSTDWLVNGVKALESDEKIGAGQSMMYALDDPSKPDKMGNYIDVFGLNYPFSFSSKLKEVFYSEGAVMFIRRDAMAEAGGLFDESYFMFYEDVDFCWRLRMVGYKVVVFSDSVVYHKRGGTVSGTIMKMDPLYVFTNTRNRLNTLLKNYSTINVVKFIPMATSMEIMKGFLLILSGKVQAGLSCFKGICSFLIGIQNTLRKRIDIQRKRKIDDKSIMRFMISSREAFRFTYENVQRLRNEWRIGQ